MAIDFSSLPKGTLSQYGIDQNSIFATHSSLQSSLDSINSNPVVSSVVSTITSEPKPPAGQSGDQPQKGEQSTPTYGREKFDKTTGIGKANQELTHECDFTIQLKLDVCGKTMINLAENWTYTMSMKSIWASASQFPFLDDIRQAYKTIKGWYDSVMVYVKQIKQYIECMKQIIQAIQQVASFIASLPANALSAISSCIGGFMNMFETAVHNTVSGILNDLTGSQNTASQNASDSLGTASTSYTDAQNTQSTQ